MTTITIPKKIRKEEELIAIPRKEYEELLQIKRRKSFSKLDKDLQEALEEIKAGKVSGPFNNVKDLMDSLESQ